MTPLLSLPLFSLLYYAATTITTCTAHVLLTYPTPRTDNDYLFSRTQGTCDPSGSCNAFCGDAYDLPTNAVTVLPTATSVTLRWLTNVAHVPYQYRFSLNPAAADDNFDSPDNILVTIDNAVAADPSNGDSYTGSFRVNVTFPPSVLATCNADQGHDPCVLQLWDLYYFVSCANVLFTTSGGGSGSENGAEGMSTTTTTAAPTQARATATPTQAIVTTVPTQAPTGTTTTTLAPTQQSTSSMTATGAPSQTGVTPTTTKTTTTASPTTSQAVTAENTGGDSTSMVDKATSTIAETTPLAPSSAGNWMIQTTTNSILMGLVIVISVLAY